MPRKTYDTKETKIGEVINLVSDSDDEEVPESENEVPFFLEMFGKKMTSSASGAGAKAAAPEVALVKKKPKKVSTGQGGKQQGTSKVIAYLNDKKLGPKRKATQTNALPVTQGIEKKARVNTKAKDSVSEAKDSNEEVKDTKIWGTVVGGKGAKDTDNEATNDTESDSD